MAETEIEDFSKARFLRHLDSERTEAKKAAPKAKGEAAKAAILSLCGLGALALGQVPGLSALAVMGGVVAAGAGAFAAGHAARHAGMTGLLRGLKSAEEDKPRRRVKRQVHGGQLARGFILLAGAGFILGGAYIAAGLGLLAPAAATVSSFLIGAAGLASGLAASVLQARFDGVEKGIARADEAARKTGYAPYAAPVPRSDDDYTNPWDMGPPVRPAPRDEKKNDAFNGAARPENKKPEDRKPETGKPKKRKLTRDTGCLRCPK